MLPQECPELTGDEAGGFAADSVPEAAYASCQPRGDNSDSSALADWQPLLSEHLSMSTSALQRYPGV